jgi:hypothetical protein
MNWTQRILEFPVRAAAVDDFLRDLRARGAGDLNAVLTTLNEGGLCREAVRHWIESGWIVVAPNTPLLALTGPAFEPELSLTDFCSEFEILEAPAPAGPDASTEEGAEQHGHS